MKKLIFVIAILSLLSGLFAQNSVELSTLEWPPYIGESMSGDGYVAQIVQEAFKRGGYSLSYKYYPWARVIKLAETGNVDGYFPEYYSESLKEKYYLSDPFPGGPLGFMVRSDSNINFNKLSDLKGYRIGVVKGYVNTQEFDSASYLTKDEGVSDSVNMKKLLEKRLDMIVIDKYVGFHILKEEYPASVGKLKFLDKVLEEKDLYVCINKSISNATKIIAAFNKGLAEMVKDGTVRQILKKNGF